MMSKCALCGDKIEIVQEVETINPETFRRATMHHWCLVTALDELSGQRASDPVNYSNRLDEYNARLAASE